MIPVRSHAPRAPIAPIAERRRERLPALPALVMVPLGILITTAAFEASRAGADWAAAVYWAGLIVMVAPSAAMLWKDELPRGQTICVLLAVAFGLYVVNALGSPGLFTGFDELLHYRTLADIGRTGRLFTDNALLPVSPRFPGLEIATHALMSATGLELVPAGLILIAVARGFTIVSLYMLLERITAPPRLAGLATLLYMAAPSFIAFDASFAYESLAVPLAVFCLFCLREAQYRPAPHRVMLDAAGAASLLAVVATHHVTSYVLVGTLMMWTAFSALKRPRDPLPGGGWVPILGLAAAVAWLAFVAPATVGYLQPHAISAWQEAQRILSGAGQSRKLFQAAGGGLTPPVIERATGIASVLLILAGGLAGLLAVRRLPRRDGLARMFTVCSLGYVVMMALRFTKSGWEIGARAMTFLYIPLAFVLATGLAYHRARRRKYSWTIPASAVITIVFLGGVIAGTSPYTRLPRPYTPGAYSASIEGEGLAAARWARAELGPGRRLVADETNMSLMGSYGEQRVINSSDGFSVSEFYLTPFRAYQRGEIADHRIEYAVIDRRIAGVESVSGYFFEKWEHDITDYGDVIDAWMLSRLDEVPTADRIFDSGGIQIYDLRRVGK